MTIYVQIGDEVREATAEEIAVIEHQNQMQVQAEAEQTAQLEARKAPLRRLGLTEDEINTVLGL
jgi:hypothetical protein